MTKGHMSQDFKYISFMEIEKFRILVIQLLFIYCINSPPRGGKIFFKNHIVSVVNILHHIFSQSISDSCLGCVFLDSLGKLTQHIFV